jgi:hypothetical protein
MTKENVYALDGMKSDDPVAVSGFQAPLRQKLAQTKIDLNGDQKFDDRDLAILQNFDSDAAIEILLNQDMNGDGLIGEAASASAVLSEEVSETGGIDYDYRPINTIDHLENHSDGELYSASDPLFTALEIFSLTTDKLAYLKQAEEDDSDTLFSSSDRHNNSASDRNSGSHSGNGDNLGENNNNGDNDRNDDDSDSNNIPEEAGFMFYSALANQVFSQIGAAAQDFGFNDTLTIVYRSSLWPPGAQNFDNPDEAALRSWVQNFVANGDPEQILDQILCIDVEHWNISLSASQQEMQENVEKYIELMDIIRDEFTQLLGDSPDLGYYGLIPCRDYWAFNLPNDPSRLEALEALNDYLGQTLLNHVDVLFPSIYTFYDNEEGWFNYAQGMLDAATEYGLPVYPFMWGQYHDSNANLAFQFIDADFWQQQLEFVAQYGATSEFLDGLVIWGTQAPQGWLEALEDIINNLRDTVLDPGSQNLMSDNDQNAEILSKNDDIDVASEKQFEKIADGEKSPIDLKDIVSKQDSLSLILSKHYEAFPKEPELGDNSKKPMAEEFDPFSKILEIFDKMTEENNPSEDLEGTEKSHFEGKPIFIIQDANASSGIETSKISLEIALNADVI